MIGNFGVFQMTKLIVGAYEQDSITIDIWTGLT